MKENKYVINLFIVLSFFLFSFISAILLLKSNNVYQGQDTQFHFKRIMELNSSFINGNFLPNFSFNEFHGSAVMTLYPYFNLFPAVLLSFIIKSKVTMIYVFFILNTFFSFIVSFYSSKNYIKNYSTSYLFASIYGLSNIFLAYNFILTDFGIVSSFIFLPLIIFGFMKIISGKTSWIELSLGMSLLALSHTLNLIIIGGFLLLWFIINLNKLNKHIMFNLFRSIILFLMINSIVWLPLLNLYIHNFNNINMPFIGQLDRISIKEFMTGLYGGKSSNTIGFFPILALLISPLFYAKFDRYIKQMYCLSFIIVACTLFLPWKFITSYGAFGLLNQFQHMFRFLIIPQMLLSFIFSLIISKYMLSFSKKKIVYFMVICIAILMQIIIGQKSFINAFSNNIPIDNYLKMNNNVVDITKSPGYRFYNSSQFYKLMNSYQGTNKDYIPKSSISMSSYVINGIGHYNDRHKIKVNHIGYNTFGFSKKDDIKELSLPIYYYNKEKLNIYLNNKLITDYTNKDGLLTINHVQDDIKLNNKVHIKPVLNLSKIISIALSFMGWLFVLGVVIGNKFTR